MSNQLTLELSLKVEAEQRNQAMAAQLQQAEAVYQQQAADAELMVGVLESTQTQLDLARAGKESTGVRSVDGCAVLVVVQC